VITTTFHYHFSISSAHCHFTTLCVKHWPITWVANQIVTQILWYLSFFMRTYILKVPDIDYIFSKHLLFSNKRQLSFQQETRHICWWLSIRLLSSQHTIIVIIAAYQQESMTGKTSWKVVIGAESVVGAA
jgi:hypothetical protein